MSIPAQAKCSTKSQMNLCDTENLWGLLEGPSQEDFIPRSSLEGSLLRTWKRFDRLGIHGVPEVLKDQPKSVS